MKDSWIGQVGVWGQRHYQYLKENKPTVLSVMRMNGNLKSYLREVDEQAEEMLFQLVKQMAKDEGVDEAMKRRDQMLWGAGVRWTPLPQAEAPTEPAGETQSPCRIPKAAPMVACGSKRNKPQNPSARGDSRDTLYI